MKTVIKTSRPGKSKYLLLLCVVLSATAFAQGQERIANEGTIGDKWMLADGATLATAQYPGHMAARGDNVCIALGYKIGRDGTTSDFSVLKQWNSESGEKEPADGFWQAFAQAGADAVSQWKFKPRPEVGNPTPTRTVATLGFTGKEQIDGAQLRSHCQIGDLAAQLQSKSNRDRILDHELDRNRIGQEERLIQQQIQSRKRN